MGKVVFVYRFDMHIDPGGAADAELRDQSCEQSQLMLAEESESELLLHDSIGLA